MSIQKYTRPLSSVAIFDPSISTRNNGDEIISQAARAQIRKILPDCFQATIPTHEGIGLRSYRFSRQARHRIIAGSNILTGRMLFDRQWRIRPWDIAVVNDLIGLGVGWRSYGQRRSGLSDVLLRKMLSRTAMHSVRDEHTRKELGKRGISNVLNTACVTMWQLDTVALATLPDRRAHRVVTTVNIGQKKAGEEELFGLLCGTYEEVFIWPQGIDDEPYIASLLDRFPKMKAIGPTLADYDDLLQEPEGVDFVGNRLHGGVRAMQHNRRALILSVDNRASEIARDTNLPVVSLADGLAGLKDHLVHPRQIEIVLPWDAIEEWKSQFVMGKTA